MFKLTMYYSNCDHIDSVFFIQNGSLLNFKRTLIRFKTSEPTKLLTDTSL